MLMTNNIAHYSQSHLLALCATKTNTRTIQATNKGSEYLFVYNLKPIAVQASVQ